MTRTTIDFGIDLGTTNSVIAEARGSELTVFRNGVHQELTPSAVYLDKQGRVIVGKSARDRFFGDKTNADIEFKRRMGTDHIKTFTNGSRSMLPEELSAEVLKSLKVDVQNATGEVIHAAVITVPAAFELPACKATKKAAELAGFDSSVLITEPVAAASAYSFLSEVDKVFWLVFDFGGGTFDAAVVHLQDGMFQTVNHQGDNQLGGSRIDWDIVDRMLVPAVARHFGLADFSRGTGNPRYERAISKLKVAAEEAKIACARQKSAQITVEALFPDADELFEFELLQSDVERLTEPYVVRAVNLARQALQEKNLGPDDIASVKLVGGPTIAPYFRERLASKEDGLGIPLDFSLDPMTVVARGAALYARGVRLDADAPPTPPPTGGVALQLEYSPVGPDAEPMIGGRVVARQGAKFTGCTIEFINSTSQPSWRSGRLSLAENGAFLSQIFAQRGRTNVIQVELVDGKGRKVATNPDRFEYTIGVIPQGTILINSIGVGTASNGMKCFIEKGAPLPTPRRKLRFRTVTELKRGQSGALLKIPLLEGESDRADRNRKVGDLEIPGREISRDVPVRSEVEVTVEIDDERIVTAEAYVPFLDMSFSGVFNLVSESKRPDEIESEADAEIKRLEEVRAKWQKHPDATADEAMNRIEDEDMVPSIRRSLSAAKTDPAEAKTAHDRVLDLRRTLDKVQDSLEWPTLIADVEEKLKNTREMLNDDHATSEDRAAFAALEREVRAAIADRDVETVKTKASEVFMLGFSIVQRRPEFWAAFFHDLCNRRASMSDQARADMLISQGQRAVAKQDFDSIRAVVQQLLSLLADDDPLRMRMSDVEVA